MSSTSTVEVANGGCYLAVWQLYVGMLRSYDAGLSVTTETN